MNFKFQETTNRISISEHLKFDEVYNLQIVLVLISLYYTLIQEPLLRDSTAAMAVFEVL